MSTKSSYQKINSEGNKIENIPQKFPFRKFSKKKLFRNKASKLSSILSSPNLLYLNESGIIERKDILNSYDQNLLKECWNELCNYIHNNYEKGKGTYIKDLGTFTFLDPEINLEGTTNQYKRDLKLRRPIFIVSPEFCENIKSGVFSKTNGLVPFIQKNYNKINMKIINYNEIALKLNISKDECVQIFKHIIKNMGEEVKNNKYFSKELPGIGVIIIKDNIFGVKFDEDFINEICDKTEKLILKRKNSYNNIDRYGYIPNKCLSDNNNKLEKTKKESSEKLSPITRLTKEAEIWLEQSLKIKPSDYDNEEENKQIFNKEEKNNPNDLWKSQSFFYCKNNNKFLLNKNNNLKNLSPEIQQAIIINKGQLIRELKEYDRNINGFITRFEAIRAFDKCNIHPKLTMEIINDLINSYINDPDNVDYYKLVTIIIKEIKYNLKNTSFNQKGNITNNSFNNKFRFGNQKIILFNKENFKNNNSCFKKIKSPKISIFKDIEKKEVEEEKNNFNIEEFNNINVKVSEIENEIMSIKLILDDIIIHKKRLENSLKYDKYMNNDQEINYLDLINLLKAYSITYPEQKIFKILKFIKITNPLKMTLNLLNKKFKECKISSYEMTDVEIDQSLNSILLDNKLDLKNILFSQNKEITQNAFVDLLHDKTQFSDNILKIFFQKLSNNNAYLTYDNLLNITKIRKDNAENILNNDFYYSSCKRILSKIKELKITIDDYFFELLKKNLLRENNSINRINFVLAMEKEEYDPPFSEKELNFIYDRMKNNKIGNLERKEFKKAINKEYNALYKVHDLIKKMKLNLDDLMFRMDIEINDYSKDINFWEFKLKLKKINSDYTNDFLESLYEELVGNLDKNINIKYLLDSLNVYQNNEFLKINKDSFIKNFISTIRSKIDYQTLKDSFEKEDNNFSGKISKAIFCFIINKYIKDFDEEDIMKFIRFSKISENPTSEVEFIKFLNMIYYEPNLDPFLLAVNELNKIYITEANKNLNNLISIINNNNSNKNYIEIETLYIYLTEKLKNENKNEQITKNIICKFDVDSDGKISLEDLKSILERYSNTDFFKYENDSKNININLHCNQILSDKEFKAVVKKIKENMKKKNISEGGLFKLLDENKDGFINNYEFNKKIEEIVELNQSLKDKFFNYLDIYKNGMIDLNTFLSRFKEFKGENMIENNNNIENIILDKLAEYILKNLNKLCDWELFNLMDKDLDGIISLNDFKLFVINDLGIFESEINDFKLERAMQYLSISKNLNITFADIKELIQKVISKQKQNSPFIDLKEIFKETNNMNLSKEKKNQDWFIQLIEKLGLYIIQKFENVENFFKKYGNLEDNKLKFEDFKTFLEENLECFQGYNLTQDEIITLYNSLDSQKKNYLTLEDLKNKLEMFDFYRKMHYDIKNFLHNNFQDFFDAFEFFLPNEQFSLISSYKNKENNENSLINIQNSNNNTKGLTLKNFYDGINNIFPGKYSNEILLTYIKKYFNIEPEENNIKNENPKLISFNQFVFIYYGVLSSYEDFFKNKYKINNKSIIKRNALLRPFSKKFEAIKKNNSTGNMTYKTILIKSQKNDGNILQKLISKFDKDPLYKIKRIISNSPDTNLKSNIYDFMNKFRNNNYMCNEFQLKNLIRQLNIGLSNIEIDEILKRSGRTYNGLVNVKDFYKYVIGKDKNKIKIEENISIILSEIKQLLYKFYSNPKLAFIFHDKEQTNKINFNKFKSIIIELYTKEQKPIPNFVLLKSCYDFVDLRKDGVIDLIEWCNVFSKISGKLDLFKGLENKKGFKELKKWEMSDDIMNIYKNIYKNRKIISLRAKNVSFGSFIKEDTLINILKENLPSYKLTNNQWKIIAQIGTKDTKGFINFDHFMNIIEGFSKM